jgi:hypothetical protein
MSRKSALLNEEVEKTANLELKAWWRYEIVVRKLDAIIAVCKFGIS